MTLLALSVDIANAQTGACCLPNGTCQSATELSCRDSLGLDGNFLGNGTTCAVEGLNCPDVLFSYTGGPQPPEITIIDGNPANVEFGVPRSRLFDAASPLDGSLADNPAGGFGTFPGVDNPTDTGILIRRGDFAVDSSTEVILCIKKTTTMTTSMKKEIIVKMTEAAGFILTPDAQTVVDSGRKNHWASIARKIAKADAEAGGVSKDEEIGKMRLRIKDKAKNNTDYQALLDGTRYMLAKTTVTKSIETVETTTMMEVVVYIRLKSTIFGSIGNFITGIEIILSDLPDPGSPMLGDLETTALVVDVVDDLGPVTVVDFAGASPNGIFTPSTVNLNDPISMNSQDAVVFTNSSLEDVTFQVFGHPLLALVLPPDSEVAIPSLGGGGMITGTGSQGSSDTVTILGIPTDMVPAVSNLGLVLLLLLTAVAGVIVIRRARRGHAAT